MTLLLLALACHQADTPDSQAPADTAADPTVDDTGHPQTRLSGAVLEPEDTTLVTPLRVAAVAMQFGEGPTVGATLSSTPVAQGAFQLILPDGAAGTIQDGVAGTLYALVAFEDADGDGSFEEGIEVVRGLGMDRWLAWEGDGWHLLDLGMSGTYAPERCLLDTTEPLTWRDGYPVEHDWSEGVTLTLSGLPATLDLGVQILALGAGQTRVAALPYQVVAGTDPTVTPALDTAIALGEASWSLGDVPDDSAIVGGDPDWRYAFYYLLPYLDGDASGAWSSGDSYDGTGPCLDGQPVNLRYSYPVASYRGWRLLDCYGANVGWRAITRDADSGWTSYLSSAQAAALVIDAAACHY